MKATPIEPVNRRRTFKQEEIPRPPRAVHYLEGQKTSQSNRHEDEEQALVLPEESDATSQLPSTLQSEPPLEHEQLLAIEKTRHPSRLAYGGPKTTPNRVGWADRGPPKLELICYKCYKKADHISPNCDLKFSDYEVIIKNYELLGQSERERVPDTSYQAALHLRSFIDQTAKSDDQPSAGTKNS